MVFKEEQRDYQINTYITCTTQIKKKKKKGRLAAGPKPNRKKIKKRRRKEEESKIGIDLKCEDEKYIFVFKKITNVDNISPSQILFIGRNPISLPIYSFF